MEALTPRVALSSLKIGEEFGEGGQGKVSEVRGYLIEDKWPAAFKRYSPDALSQLSPETLEKFVIFARQLPPQEKSWLYETFAWPVSIVMHESRACGFLMRRIPSDYYFDFQHQATDEESMPSDVAFLLNSDRYVSDAGLQVTDRDRLRILETIATNLSRLHDLNVVIGDLSPKNVLFRLGAYPGSFFIDCDSFRLNGETALKQLETPDWAAPDGEPKATKETDSYKFGLLAIRLFAREQATHDVSAIRAISPALGRLALASQSAIRQDANGSRRPKPEQWVGALKAAANSLPRTRAAPPRAGQAGVYQRPTSLPVRPFPKRAALLILGAAVALILIFVFAILPALTGSPPAASATNPAAKEEAATINALLDQSSSNQLELELAMNHISACSDVAGNDGQVNVAVGKDTGELSEASGLPVAALPNGPSLKGYLVEVLRISLHADEDYLTWANGVTTRGCNAHNLQTPTYANGYVLTEDVVAAKLNFLALWNPVATAYGFQPRTQSDI